jgi:hypothetical protein
MLSATQRAFVADEHRYVLLLGGVGAGKSYAGAVKALLRFTDPQPSLGIVISPTYPMLRDATWRTAIDVAAAHPQGRREHHAVCFGNGHEVLFRSADEAGFRGLNAPWGWIDEAALCHLTPGPLPSVARQFGHRHGLAHHHEGDELASRTPGHEPPTRPPSTCSHLPTFVDGRSPIAALAVLGRLRAAGA